MTKEDIRLFALGLPVGLIVLYTTNNVNISACAALAVALNIITVYFMKSERRKKDKKITTIKDFVISYLEIIALDIGSIVGFSLMGATELNKVLIVLIVTVIVASGFIIKCMIEEKQLKKNKELER